MERKRYSETEMMEKEREEMHLCEDIRTSLLVGSVSHSSIGSTHSYGRNGQINNVDGAIGGPHEAQILQRVAANTLQGGG